MELTYQKSDDQNAVVVAIEQTRTIARNDGLPMTTTQDGKSLANLPGEGVTEAEGEK